MSRTTRHGWKINYPQQLNRWLPLVK